MKIFPKIILLVIFLKKAMIQAACAKNYQTRSCRFLSVMLSFCVGIQDKLQNGKYKFLHNFFNSPSDLTLSWYDYVGGNDPDSILYSVLQALIDEFGLEEYFDEWKRMVSLKFD